MALQWIEVGDQENVMATLTDPEVLACYVNALSNWRYEGFVEFLDDASKGLRKYLPGHTQRGFKALLHEFVVLKHGEIDQVVEERENWKHKWAHHYDVRPVINGIRIYVETRLSYSDPADPDDPIIYLVNIKPA